jgi:taurine transport system permease protein
MARMIGRYLLPALLPLAVVAVWAAVAAAGMVTPFLLPAPADVATRLVEDTLSGDLSSALGITLARMATGFALAAILGVLAGVLMTRSKLVRWLFDPIVSVAMPMPKLAFLPIFLLWFGVHDTAKLVLIVVSCVFPIIVATEAAAAGVERDLMWSARSLGVSKAWLLWDVVLPAALPEILTGLQVALPIALVVTVVAEMLMGGAGLGAELMRATRFADSEGVYAGLLTIAVAGGIVGQAMALLRRRLLRWKPVSG